MPGRPRRRSGGPRTLLEPEVQLALCKKVEEGTKLWTAAGRLGLKPDTVNTWYTRGLASHDEPYHSFAKAVRASAIIYLHHAEGVYQHHAIDNPHVAKDVLDDWRRFARDPTLADEAEGPTLPAVTTVNTNYITITAAEVDAIVRRNLAEERGDADLDDATRAARARLVTDLSQT